VSRRGKKYQEAIRRFDRQTAYPARDAVELVKQTASAGFDETVEAVFVLGIDPRKADQLVRGTVALPHGTGKSVRVAVFAPADRVREAEEAGADVVGGKELVAELAAGGPIEFDIAVATPDMMAEVGKLGRILGPRGLMPNPKAGTVTPEVAKAVTEFKAGRIEYRNDRFGNIHVPVGKASFEAGQLLANLAAVAAEIVRVKPSSAKGRYVKKLVLSSTMGPGVQVDTGKVEELTALAR
jgi:large subunit ribosomal protein L1